MRIPRKLLTTFNKTTHINSLHGEQKAVQKQQHILNFVKNSC